MSADTKPSSSPDSKDLIALLDEYLVRKAPFQIPESGREAIVKFGPWIVALVLLLSLPSLFVILGLSTAFLPYGAIGYGLLWGIVYCVQLGLMALALPGLFARKKSGWMLVFYAQIVSTVAAVMSYAFLSAVVVGVIAFYVLFQVRTLYKN